MEVIRQQWFLRWLCGVRTHGSLGWVLVPRSKALTPTQVNWIGVRAEREGFEPSVRSPPRSLSKGVLSTTQPSLLILDVRVARLIHPFARARQSFENFFLIYFHSPIALAYGCIRACNPLAM